MPRLSMPLVCLLLLPPTLGICQDKALTPNGDQLFGSWKTNSPLQPPPERRLEHLAAATGNSAWTLTHPNPRGRCSSPLPTPERQT